MSEIAYEPGFEHLQSFSRLSKAKTRLPPPRSGNPSGSSKKADASPAGDPPGNDPAAVCPPVQPAIFPASIRAANGKVRAWRRPFRYVFPRKDTAERPFHAGSSI